MVGTVQEDGFFHNAGIREGDQIILVNGENVATEAEFRRHILAGRGRFPVVVMRNGEREEILVSADDLQAAANVPTQERTDDRAALGIWFYAMPEGAHVVHVVPGSPAERAGLRQGDFVTSLNGEPCTDWQAVTERVAQAEPQSAVKMQVSRRGETLAMEATLGGYFEVFSNPARDWNTIAAEQGYSEPTRRGAQYDGRSGYWTGRQDARGSEYDQGARMQPSGVQALERRIRQLEQEVADLREQLSRGNSTNAPARNQDTGRNGEGQRTSAPAERQNNGQRTDAPPDGH